MSPVRRRQRISLYALILPRLEAFFLDEWIAFHSSIGVDEFFIYENGLRSIDDRDHGTNAPPRGTTWAKKPEAEYFTDQSDERISAVLDAVVEMHPHVHLRRWHHPFSSADASQGERPSAQVSGFEHCLGTHDTDWWLHIDPDEFLFPRVHGDLQRFLAAHQGFTAYRVHQRVFDRRRAGQSVLATVRWGYDCEIVKSLVRADSVTEPRVHATETSGRSLLVPFETLRLHHYRGHPRLARGSMHMPCASSTFDKTDTSLRDFASTPATRRRVTADQARP